MASSTLASLLRPTDAPVTAGLIFTLILCLAYFAYQKALPKPIPGIPYDEAAAKNIFGSIPSMTAHIKKHGTLLPWMTNQNITFNAPLVQFFGLPGSKPTFVLCDFQESQDLLVRRMKEFDRSQETLDGFVDTIPQHHVSMRTTDPRFKGNKELVRDLMSPSFLQNVSAGKIYSKAQQLVDLWTAKANAASGRPFAAREDVFDAALDMVNAAAFSLGDDLSVTKPKVHHIIEQGPLKDANSGSGTEPIEFPKIPYPPEVQAMKGVADFLGTQTYSPNKKATYWYAMITRPQLRRDLAEKDCVIKQQLKDSLDRLEAGDETKFSATDYMVQREYTVAKKENRNFDLYSRRMIDELFGYIVGGHETTSCALSWMLKFLSDHQDVQKRLRQDLRTYHAAAVAESRQPDAQEIGTANIPYFDAVVEESLRLGAPAPVVAREATQDTTLLGHIIPKGSTVMISSAGPGFYTSSHTIPDSLRSESSKAKFTGDEWDEEDRMVFQPERWLKMEDGKVVFDPQAGPFLAFSLGPRGCFGRKLAYLEIKLILTLLLWNFDFHKLEGPLAGYEKKEGVAVMPKYCYVKVDVLG